MKTQSKGQVFKKTILISLLGLSAMNLSSNALASGSFGGGSSSSFASDYNLGKSVFYRKLACNSCPIPGTSIDKQDAKSIIKKIQKSDFKSSLRRHEKRAIVYYLNRRFKLG